MRESYRYRYRYRYRCVLRSAILPNSSVYVSPYTLRIYLTYIGYTLEMGKWILRFIPSALYSCGDAGLAHLFLTKSDRDPIVYLRVCT